MKSGLVLVVVLCLLVVLGITWKAKQKKKVFVEELSFTKTPRTIKVERMSKAEISNALNEFEKLYDNPEYIKSIVFHDKGNHVLLEFPSSVTFIDFALLVNYLVYSDKSSVTFIDFALLVNYLVYSDKEKRHNNDIQGTYPFGDMKSALPSVDFSHQEATLFIPEEDTEFDNVYFKCCGHRFKMDFSDWSVRIIQ